MNLKIEDNKLTFKINGLELETLLAADTLLTQVCISGAVFAARIVPVAGSRTVCKLDAGPSIVLEVLNQHIQELSDMGRDKTGLSIQQDGLDMLLQVDVRGDVRKPSSTHAA